VKSGSYIPVAYQYPPKPPFRWKRIHTSFVIALIFNSCVLVMLGWYAGAFAEEAIYEVNLADVMKTDATVKTRQKVKRLTLNPADVSKIKSKRSGGGSPAAAPGHRPDNPMAKAPPKLKINAPQVTPDSNQAEPDPGMVSNSAPPPDATDDGNPEGAAGGKGNEEGPGGKGAGGNGTGGTGNGTGTGDGDGSGNGSGGKLASLVNQVHCKGCHPLGTSGLSGCEPDQIERVISAIRWRHGGQPHDLTLEVTINAEGYIEACRVTQSSGRSDVDESAIDFVKLSKWKPARASDGTPFSLVVEMPLEVYF